MHERRHELVWTGFAALALALVPACTETPDGPDERREFVISIENLAGPIAFYRGENMTTAEGDVLADPLQPGQSYTIEVEVAPDARLQLMTMLVDSNDAFVAFEPGGIRLWDDDGEALVGDRSDELRLWDAGTEVNEPLGAGDDQPLRQGASNTGADQGGVVSAIEDGEGPEGVAFPAVADFAEVEVEHLGEWVFRVTLTNVSDAELLEVPEAEPKPALLSAAFVTIHGEDFASFAEDQAASPALESLAEDGETAALLDWAHANQNRASELSPVVWAVHDGDIALYSIGADASVGLEVLAEDAEPTALFEDLAAEELIDDYGWDETPDTQEEIQPQETVEIYIEAGPGDRFSFVTGYLAGNDKFIAPGSQGIALFDENGEPQVGDLSYMLDLLDAGTELDEAPGLGPNQYAYQSGPNAGPDEDDVVREVGGGEWVGYTYPAADELVRVEVSLVRDY